MDEYLRGATSGTAIARFGLQKPVVICWLANQNPVVEPYRELFDDTPLRQETAYPLVMAGCEEFFATQPAFGSPTIRT